MDWKIKKIDFKKIEHERLFMQKFLLFFIKQFQSKRARAILAYFFPLLKSVSIDSIFMPEKGSNLFSKSFCTQKGVEIRNPILNKISSENPPNSVPGRGKKVVLNQITQNFCKFDPKKGQKKGPIQCQSGIPIHTN